MRTVQDVVDTTYDMLHADTRCSDTATYQRGNTAFHGSEKPLSYRVTKKLDALGVAKATPQSRATLRLTPYGKRQEKQSKVPHYLGSITQ